jgi:hypothetical protein
MHLLIEFEVLLYRLFMAPFELKWAKQRQAVDINFLILECPDLGAEKIDQSRIYDLFFTVGSKPRQAL